MSIASTGQSKFARKLTKRMVAERYSVSERTIDRWTEAGILPQPDRINKRPYYDEDGIEQRERERMSAARYP
jgi:DNA-binding transcriptional MerR regulator